MARGWELVSGLDWVSEPPRHRVPPKTFAGPSSLRRDYERETGRQARPPFPVGPFYVKGCSIHGLVMFAATEDEMRGAAEEINRWLGEGKIRAQIDRVLPLCEAAQAHRLQEENTLQKAGTLAGKIVLVP